MQLMESNFFGMIISKPLKKDLLVKCLSRLPQNFTRDSAMEKFIYYVQYAKEEHREDLVKAFSALNKDQQKIVYQLFKEVSIKHSLESIKVDTLCSN